jgi:hypothetical protein
MLNKEEVTKLQDILVSARKEIDNGWTEEVDQLIRNVFWLATKLKEIQAEILAEIDRNNENEQ